MGRLHHRTKTRKIRKEARTRPIPGHYDYGDGRDAGRYYRCWNCGFPCDVERDELGGPDDRSKISSQIYSQVDQYGATSDLANHTIYDSDYAGPDGTTYPSWDKRYKPKVGSGCPMCGTLNWMGKHP